MARFTLFDLMFLTTVAAVVSGALASNEVWGAMVLVLVVPITVRSLRAYQRRAAANLSTTTRRKLGVLLSSLSVVLLGYLGAAAWVAATAWVGSLATSPDSAEDRLRSVGMALLPLAVLVGLTALGGRWVGFRWERDTTCE